MTRDPGDSGDSIISSTTFFNAAGLSHFARDVKRPVLFSHSIWPISAIPTLPKIRDLHHFLVYTCRPES